MPIPNPKTIKKYWHTMRHLRFIQIYGRLWFRFHRPKPDMRPAPPLRNTKGQWTSPIQLPSTMKRPARFFFLNIEGKADSAHDWNTPDQEKLWLYNLHYFNDLNAIDNHSRTKWHQDIIDRWITDNPPGHGNGWEPYPSSLRIVNWIKWAMSGNQLQQNQIDSLAVQTRYLCSQMEWYLLGNHLFANGKALLFAGLFFEGPEAKRWRKIGLYVLKRELGEQILSDGGNFELSPMYHAIILEDVLDLINIDTAFPDNVAKVEVLRWKSVIDPMLTWLAAMSHPDGEISFFNDAAMAIAPSHEALSNYARQLGLQEPKKVGTAINSNAVTHLYDTGYIRLEKDDMVAILDVGPIGPTYLPGHGHADILSFELSLFGQRVLVNSGTSQYGNDAERQRQRSTSAHNTVELNGNNSSDVWGGFRVAQRANPHDLEIDKTSERIVVGCAHDGYKTEPGCNTHRRTWTAMQGEIEVKDHIDGPFEQALARYHLHPDVSIELDPCTTKGRIRLPEGQLLSWSTKGVRATTLENSTWHPEFGQSHPSKCLVLEAKQAEFSIRLSFAD